MNKQDNVSMFRALGIYEDILNDIDWYIKERAHDKTKEIDFYLSYGSNTYDMYQSIMHFFGSTGILTPSKRLMYQQAIDRIKYLKQ